MLGILASFGVVAFKSATDITFKFANKIVSDDKTLLLYQRSVEALVALVVIFAASIFYSHQTSLLWIFDYSFWLLSIVTVILGSLAFFFYLRALRYSDVSLVAPMMLLTPAILLVTSPIMLGEYSSLGGIVGVLFIVFGSYFIGFSLEKQKRSFWGPFIGLFKEKGVKYAFLASLLYGITANLDKIGVLKSSPFIWIFIQGALLTIGLGIFMLFKERISLFLDKKQAGIAIIPGFTGAFSSILQMVAISLWQVPYVIAIKRTSSLVTIIAGGVIFKEKNIFWRLVGASIMIVGVLLILFFG